MIVFTGQLLYYNLKLYFQSCRENKIQAENVKYHALVFLFPCLGNKITRVGNKIGSDLLITPSQILCSSPKQRDKSTAYFCVQLFDISIELVSPR